MNDLVKVVMFSVWFGGMAFSAPLLAQTPPRQNNSVQNLSQFQENERRRPKLPPPQEFLPDELILEEDLQTIPQTITVKGFKFVGNTVFTGEELTQLTIDLVGESVSFAALLEARSRVTEHYINHGYITSAAYLPSGQVIEDGIVTIKVIEGSLKQINIEGLKRLTPNYLRSRIKTNLSTPLQINDLVTVLEQLKRNRLLENLTAELAAGSQVGESILNLKVQPANPIDVGLAVNNYQSRTIGVWQQKLQLQHHNALGWGDRLSLSYENTGGGNQWGVDYILPINGKNGTIRFSYQNFDADVIEEPFNQVDLETASRKYEIALRQPLINKLTEEFALGAVLFHQISETRLLGVQFPLSQGAEEDGVTRLSGVRFFQEWSHRSPQDVVLVRNQFNFGMNWLDATENDTAPDSNFFSWQLDGQWLHSFGEDHLLVTRLRGQLTDRPVLSAEDLTIGGVNSVRGYRRDLYLLDRGVLASIEYRFPLVRSNDSVVQSFTFLDMAWGGNTGDFPDPDPNYLASVGIGLRWQLLDRLSAEIGVGIPLVAVSDRNQEKFLFSISIPYSATR